MSAATEKGLQAVAKATTARDSASDRNASLRDQALGMAAQGIGGGLTAQGIGSGLGTMAATLIGGPVAGALLPAIGGALGGLFGKGGPKTQVTSSLQAIERAARETVTAIDRQTDRLIDPLASLLNLPSTFRVPTYNPSMTTGGTTVYEGSTTVQMTFNVTQAQDPEEIQRLARKGVEQALEQGRRNTPRNSKRY